MERTNKSLSPEEKWIATADHLSRHVPGCERLADYRDDWIMNRDNPEAIKQIKRDINYLVRTWMRGAGEDEIRQTVATLNPAAREHIKQLMPLHRRGWFEHRGGQFPIELSVPMIFRSIEKQNLSNVAIRRPITISWGKNRIEIKNNYCTADDIKVWVATNQIRKRSRVRKVDRYIITYETRFVDIAKELGKNNPYSKSAHDSILHSLERSRGMTMTHYEGTRFKHLGGLLHSATDLEEDSTGLIEIHQDSYWFELMNLQFTGIDEKILYSLPGKQAVFYVFLSRFRSFNKFGNFNSEEYNLTISGVYDLAGLKSPFKEPDMSYIRYDMKQQLEGLQHAGIVKKSFDTTDDMLVIGDKKKKVTRNFGTSCPHGHNFGEDWDDTDNCEGCEKWYECYDEYKANFS